MKIQQQMKKVTIADENKTSGPCPDHASQIFKGVYCFKQSELLLKHKNGPSRGKELYSGNQGDD